MNKCPNCDSNSLTILNYNPYNDTFIYRCNCCGFSCAISHNEPIKDTDIVSTNKTTTSDKFHHYCNTVNYCPNCGNLMSLQTNGTFVCSKCGLVSNITTNPNTIKYDEIYKNNVIQGNLSLNEVKIIADKVIITESSIGVTIDLSKSYFDSIDSIVINGVKFNKE